ncbi:MAG: esterase [Citromicrobium sp.]|nr:esterase [Citromicrobium sp.]MAS86215.1 esterase [Erythrobacteraceae bacterium]MBD76676.1 esterase [Citromicrobium sp.]MBT48166.1 esterase [Citromicrobium sp.]|tara:strand:+ start:462 stop:1481 length:1020 start_codon:yes stop_codon:yes gene_type:complete
MLKKLALSLGLAASLAMPAAAQETARLNIDRVDSPAIEGNLEANTMYREVYVITPPGYDENPDARYPVVYFLHGYWGSPERYAKHHIDFTAAVDKAAAAGHPMILVVPNGDSKWKGAFYSSGPTVGDYEGFVAHDLVSWIDEYYRSIPEAASRGLSGHSMGGYGTARVALKNPGIFSSIYMMSACCLDPAVMTPEMAQKIESMSPEEVENAEFFQLAAISTLVAWSPDPTDEGFLKADTGLREDGTIDPLVNQRIAANAPVVILPQYLRSLTTLDGFAMDIGDKDFLLEGNRIWRAELDRFGVDYDFELYKGDHTNRVNERFADHVMPFFAEHLEGPSE